MVSVLLQVSHFLLNFSKTLSSYYSRYHILGVNSLAFKSCVCVCAHVVCVCVNVCACAHVLCVCAHMRTRTCMYVCVYALVSVCVCVCVLVCMYISLFPCFPLPLFCG